MTAAGPKGDVRPIFMSILFTMISCGFYGMYWWWKMASEVNAYLGTNRFSLFKLWAFTSISCGLYGFYFMFVDGKEIIKEVQVKAGLPPNPPFMCDLVRMQKALNTVWEQIPG